MIYVDGLIYRRTNGKKFYCHMFADSKEELHDFAQKIERNRCWYHLSNNQIPHYDLDESFRKKAIEMGAKEISSREYLLIVNGIKCCVS